MPPKNPLFQKCLAYLESLPNIKATLVESYFSSEVLADGELTIINSHNTVNYVCEIKTGLTNDVVEQVADYLTNLGGKLKPGQKPLLVTRSLSNLVVDQLLERNIEFIDVDGNIYLNSPGIYVVVRKQTSKDSTNKSLEITSTALQVMYALLSQPNTLKGDDIEQISYISGVSTKTVKSTLKKLNELDYITYKHGRYEIIDYVKLLERWELGYSETLRSKLLIGTFSPIGKRNFSEIEDDLKKYADQYGYLIGGELAASILTEYLRPISAILHLGKNVDYRKIAVKLKLKPDPEGSIALLESFGHDKYDQNEFGGLKNIVHPLLIHAELVRTGNSRLKETAILVYERYIEEIAQKNYGF
ncbi:MAG: type IV toxin-antitoxin system AbiEi family antitoxin [Planktothrix sp. GU0601_MAG3]|nr:MAG: type IV toxin-antitoxin system AbiEi family antitoxin [Planktothrix sp. GU0601_MAG3]